MPGEQLTCVLQAVSAVGGQKEDSTNIPKPVLNGVIHSLQQLKSVNLSNDAFRQYFSERKKISYEDIKFFVCNYMRATDVNIKDLCDEIESACWNICKDTVSAPLQIGSLEKLWRVASRLMDENTFPPKIARGECSWFMTKLSAMLGNEWMSKEASTTDSDLSFQEFVDLCMQSYFGKMSRDKVDSIIDGFHSWLVDETLKFGWLYKRSRKQANWTSWVKRWCILTPIKIEFSKRPRGKAIDSIEIKRHTKMEPLAPYQGIIQTYKYRFKISNYPIAECELNTESEPEKTLWISCLEDAVNAAKENTTPVQRLLKRRRNDGNQANQAERELDRMFQKTVKLRTTTPTSTDEGKDVKKEEQDNHDVKNSAIPEVNIEEKESYSAFLEQERQKLKTIFLKIDKDGNGVLSRGEFSDFVKSMGLEMTKNEIDLVFNTCDKDKNGQVTFDEFQQYFVQHILGETGTGKCVAALRRAFLKADRTGSGTLTFKEFTEYIWDRKRSVRISSLLDVFGKMGKDTDEVSFNDFQEFLLREQKYLPLIEEEGQDEKAFERQLKCAFDETEAEELSNYVRGRWEAFATFRRKGARGKTVMKGGHGMVADFVPGEYSLVDLACFSDLPPLVPKHTVVKEISWQSSSERGKSGKVVFPKDFDGKIQTDIATNELLRYYDCSFADSQQERISLLFRHGIQDFTYENEYLSDYVKATNGGAGIERHEFSHLDCPLDEQSGYFILAKMFEDELHVTAFKVPIRHTLYIPGGTIHSNDYLEGTWRTMLSDEVDIDHVHLTKQGANDCLEHFSFEFIK